MTFFEKYLNTNNSNNAGYDEALISTDEDEEVNTLNNNISPGKNDSVLSRMWTLFNTNDSQPSNNVFENNNGEIMYSEDDEDNSASLQILSTESNANQTNKRKLKCEGVLTFSQKVSNLLHGSAWVILRLFLKFLRFIRNMIILMYLLFILIANLPFAMMKNFLLFLKCYTESPCIHYVPVNLIPAIYKHFIAWIQNIFICKFKIKLKPCRSSCSNTSNSLKFSRDTNINSSDLEECVHSPIFIYPIAVLAIIVFSIFCYSNPNSKICKIQFALKNIKTNIIEYSRNLYTFPGEVCMKSGRCCKGYLEGIFRWLSCTVTIPIRMLLMTWPKSHDDRSHQADALHEIGSYIDKLTEEINQIKDDIDLQEESLAKINTNFIILLQKVHEKANAINKLKPKLVKSEENLKKMKLELRNVLENLKKSVNLRNEADKMVDLVQMDATDSEFSVKGALNRMYTTLQAEQQRIQTEVKELETILKEEQSKLADKNERLFQRIQKEIDTIKEIQIETKKRMIPLAALHLRFREMSDNFHKDTRNKLNVEMVHHDQMKKRTERYCSNGIQKLDNELKKMKNSLTCFINRTIVEKAFEITNKLRLSIFNGLRDQTIDITNSLILQELAKASKNIKKSGQFSNLFNMRKVSHKCLENEIYINTSLLCIPDEIETSADEENRLKDFVDELIDESLNSLSADDIGMADYALESSGGSVLPDRSTGTYAGRAAFLSLFGFNFGKMIKSIRKIIQPGNLPGECWAFKGTTGYVVIRLAKPIVVSAVTIDHASRLLTPDGKIKSAPKTFSIHALKDHQSSEDTKLGDFEYSENGDPIQTFYLKEASPLTQYVKFDFLTNHGNEEYTCIYRIRVHGFNPTQ